MAPRKTSLACALALAGAATVSACDTPQPAYYVGVAPYFAPPQAVFGLRPEPRPCAQWVFDYSGDRVCASY